MKKSFLFSSLPQELKNYILDYVDVDEFLKFPKTSHQLRIRVLKFGPFPRKIARIIFVFEPSSCNMTIHSPFPKEFQLRWRGINQPADLSAEDYGILSTEYYFKTINSLIRSVQSVQIFDNGIAFSEILEWILEKFPLLPNIANLQNLEIRAETPSLYVFMKHFQPNISNCLKLQFSSSDIDINPEKRKEFLKETLQMFCFKNIKMMATRGNLHLGREELVEIGSDLVLDVDCSRFGFFESVKGCLKDGIPSKNPQALLVLGTKFRIGFRFGMSRPLAYSHIGKDFGDLVEKTSGIQLLDKDSVEAFRFNLLNLFLNFPFSRNDLHFLSDESYDNPLIFDRNYQMIRFFKKRFEDYDRAAVILALVERDRYEEYSEEYREYCDYEIESDEHCRMKFVMKYV